MTATPGDLTGQVLAAYAGTPEPRLRELLGALIGHLHAFAAETRLTPREWLAGIEFLTAAGRMCDGERQEFILLSDVLGLSSLVEDVNAVAGGTEPTVLGPFYLPELRPAPLASGSAAPRTAAWPWFAARSPTSPGRRCRAPLSTSGRPAATGCTTHRTPSSRRSTCEASSAPDRTAATSSARPGPPATRFPSTARSAGCCVPPAGVSGAPRTST